MMEKVLVLLLVLLAKLGRPCEFPVSWQTQWFSGNTGEVRIYASVFTGKGLCVQSAPHYYLMENKETGCFFCLYIIQRHQNVLQYKESICGGREPLTTTCSRTTVMWHTLIREVYVPSECPFQEKYHFSYNNNTGGWCRYPSSEAKPCADPAHYRIHFNHCPIEIASYTYNRDADLVCIGNWEHQGHFYMVGKLVTDDFLTKQQQYRCFIYDKKGTIMYMAFSGDASCRGLENSRSGPIITEMTQDTFGRPETACSFHFKGRWRNLAGDLVYDFSGDTSTFYVKERQHLNISNITTTVRAFRCLRLEEVEGNKDDRDSVALAFRTQGCSSQYQCIKFVRIRKEVMEFYEGKSYSIEPKACSPDSFQEATRKVLMTDDPSPHHCPILGRHQIHTGVSTCISYFRSGCNGSSVIDIVSACSSKPGMQLLCLKSWRENRNRYIIARKPSSQDGAANCFVIRQLPNMNAAQFSVDADCNVGTPYILQNAIYTMHAKAIECEQEKFPNDIPIDERFKQSNVHKLANTESDLPTKGEPYKRVEGRSATNHRTPHLVHNSAATLVTCRSAYLLHTTVLGLLLYIVSLICCSTCIYCTIDLLL